MCGKTVFAACFGHIHTPGDSPVNAGLRSTKPGPPALQTESAADHADSGLLPRLPEFWAVWQCCSAENTHICDARSDLACGPATAPRNTSRSAKGPNPMPSSGGGACAKAQSCAARQGQAPGARKRNTGDPGVIRTRGLRFRKPSLYPAELRSQHCVLAEIGRKGQQVRTV
jgi:hypothetical protein